MTPESKNKTGFAWVTAFVDSRRLTVRVQAVLDAVQIINDAIINITDDKTYDLFGGRRVMEILIHAKRYLLRESIKQKF